MYFIGPPVSRSVLEKLQSYDLIVILGDANSAIHEAIFRLKYTGDCQLTPIVVEALAESKHSLLAAHFDFVVEVPPKVSQRVIQPAFVLAESVAQQLNVTVDPSLIRMSRSLPDLRYVEPSLRPQVMRSAYLSDSDAVRGKRILVVDDFILSGVTLYEIARTLTTEVACLAAVVGAHAKPFGTY